MQPSKVKGQRYGTVATIYTVFTIMHYKTSFLLTYLRQAC